jgi:23S rRNA pseudouridine2604 synthase
MILTNDGSIFNKTIHSDQEKEKEYIVTVDKKLNDDFLNCLSNGILIMGQMTKPAQVFQESSHVFRIVLKQGLNRQIRRMCYKFDYEVLTLKRIRIVNIVLGDLEIGAWRNLTAQEIENLKNI